MKVAVVGSRNRTISPTELANYLPDNTDCIVSGGARGIDRCAALYAHTRGVRLIEILPDYPRYGHSAPIRRNGEIVELADYVLIFWDGTSPGSRNVIQRCRDTGTPYRIELL